jgi:hypothetical protein
MAIFSVASDTSDACSDDIGAQLILDALAVPGKNASAVVDGCFF